METQRALWSCPRCGRTFANTGQVHTCARLGELENHLSRASPAVRATVDAFLDAVTALGPVEVLPQRTRIALHVRMSFAALVPRTKWLDGHLVLAHRVDSPRFRRVEAYSHSNVVHTFRLTSPAEVDDQFKAWLAEAYRVGRQEHLQRP
ncbi:MAG TPA: DUF5655 domain-containing protein [Jiangellaceae bacterium]